jgi:hypothetical protein
MSPQIVLRTLLVAILLVVTSLVIFCMHAMLRRSDSAGWTSAKRLAGRSSQDLKGISASFKYAGLAAKMVKRRGGGRKGESGEDMDVGDTCVLM